MTGGADTITDFTPFVLFFGSGCDLIDVPDSVVTRPHDFAFQTGATSIEQAAALAGELAPHLGDGNGVAFGVGGVGAMMLSNTIRDELPRHGRGRGRHVRNRRHPRGLWRRQGTGHAPIHL